MDIGKPRRIVYPKRLPEEEGIEIELPEAPEKIPAPDIFTPKKAPVEQP